MGKQQNIAIVTYETPFAPCGGVAAVMSYLPQAMREVSSHNLFVITPFHRNIAKTAELLDQGSLAALGTCQVPLGDSKLDVTIHRLARDGVHWVFLEPSSEDIFAGRLHPFDVGHSLTRDALVFGAAVAGCLDVLDQDGPWVLMLQDWEAATAALACQSRPGPRCFLTLHNSYDSYAYEHDLTAVGIAPQLCPGDTILQRALGVCEKTVFTVSEQFALDLVEDPLQRLVLAPHLTWILADRLVGVNNGRFASLALPEKEYRALAADDFAPARAWKRRRRESFVEAIQRVPVSEDMPVWGSRQDFIALNRRSEPPWFIMAGRDDPRQKGYDVLAYAVENYYQAGGTGQFVLFPIPGDEGREGLIFLKKLAEAHAGRLLVFPYIFREGYQGALQGSAFGLMPSLYEPFGAASEFYMNCAVGIARATGGLIQQIVPYEGSDYIWRMAARWHDPEARPTGFLYREPEAVSNHQGDWLGINAAGYEVGYSDNDRLAQRSGYGLFREMGAALCQSLLQAEALYVGTPHAYHAMLARGMEHIIANFSWEKAARQYLSHI